jgi:transposase
MLAKALLGARSQLLSMSLALENQIRGILKTFGRIVPKGAGGLFERNVRALITDDAEIAAVIMPLLQARGMARSKCAALDRRLIGSVQADVTCRRLMTMPGIGPLTAVAYVAALEKPDTFKRSRAVGVMKVNKTDANDAEGLAHLVRAGWYREVRVKSRNAMLAKALLGARSQLLSMSLALENQIRGILKTAWLGLTLRRFQSGEVDYDGHISRRSDGQLRALRLLGVPRIKTDHR